MIEAANGNATAELQAFILLSPVLEKKKSILENVGKGQVSVEVLQSRYD